MVAAATQSPRMIVLLTLLIAGVRMAFAVHQWWHGHQHDGDRLHYFRAGHGGRCHRSRQGQPKCGSHTGFCNHQKESVRVRERGSPLCTATSGPRNPLRLALHHRYFPTGDERRTRNPYKPSEPRGRGVLCRHAQGHRSRAGKCADACRHHARN